MNKLLLTIILLTTFTTTAHAAGYWATDYGVSTDDGRYIQRTADGYYDSVSGTQVWQQDDDHWVDSHGRTYSRQGDTIYGSDGRSFYDNGNGYYTSW